MGLHWNNDQFWPGADESIIEVGATLPTPDLTTGVIRGKTTQTRKRADSKRLWTRSWPINPQTGRSTSSWIT